MDKLKGRVNVCVVNDAYRLAPWANVLYATDRNWWAQNYRYTLDFEGERWGLGNPMLEVHKVAHVGKSAHRGGLAEAEPIIIGTNSGHAAINLIHVIFGARRIGLLGYDMQVRDKDRPHFFGKHPEGFSNPIEGSTKRWRICFDDLAADAKRLGVEIVNCTRDTALEAFPRESLESWLERVV